MSPTAMPFALLAISATLCLPAALCGADEWKAPADAVTVANPLAAAADAPGQGAAVYRQNCVVCHGDAGKGDGPGGQFFTPKPTNLTDAVLWNESDGSLFWKLSTGRNAMPAWKALLNDQQRWQVITYIRTLSPRPAQNGASASRNP
jgi:mono/diheme cytochrome c family protein